MDLTAKREVWHFTPVANTSTSTNTQSIHPCRFLDANGYTIEFRQRNDLWLKN